MTDERPSFTCPRCRMTSHHPDDARHGYCGACHAFTGAAMSPRLPHPAPAPPGTDPRHYAAMRLCLTDGHQPGVTPDGQPCAYHRSVVDIVARTLLAEGPAPVKAPEPGTGELGTLTPEMLRAVEALREFDWSGFDPTSLDDLASVAGAVLNESDRSLAARVDFADALPPSED